MRYCSLFQQRRVFQTILLAFAALTSWAQTAVFTPVSSIQVSDKFASPIRVAVADVNGDRIPDILFAATDGIHVMIAAGGGRFDLSQLVLAGNFLTLITADFNRDGLADMAAGSRSNSTTVLLGDGTGKFRKSAELSGVSYKAADLNGDGAVDLVVPQARALSVYAGEGDGTFQPGPAFPLAFPPTALVMADLNRDGRMDIVVGLDAPSDRQNVTVLLGSGGWSFRSVENPPLCPYADDLAVADFNSDRIPDLACANGGIIVLAGKGDGTFTRQWATGDPDTALSIAAADCNGDGLADLAVGHYYSGTISILLASADGAFRPGVRFASMGDVFQMVSADLNGDAKPDLVIPSYSASTVLVALGTGNGEFAGPVCFGWGDRPRLQVEDLNADGVTDVVIVLPYRKTIITVDGSSGRRQLVFVPNYPFDVAVIDANADRIPDLVMASARQIAAGRQSLDSSLELSVLPGRGDGSFGAPITTALGKSMTGDLYQLPVVLAVGDFTGNGAIGAVVADNIAGTLGVYRGSGDGTFSRVASLPISPALRMLAADLNADGIQDVAVLSSGSVHFYSGAATGLSLLGSNAPGCDRTTAGIVGDFNGDRKPDLALACNDGRLKLLANSGSGSFQDTATMRPGFPPRLFALSDFDGDRSTDIITVALDSESRAVNGVGRLMLGKGDGTFRESAVVRWPNLLDLLPITPAGDTRTGLVLLERMDNPARYPIHNQLQITLLRSTIPGTPPAALEVVSAASFKAGNVAFRSIVSIFGEGLSPSTEAATSIVPPLALGATSVTLTDYSGMNLPMPLFFVSPGQINALVPGLGGGLTTITVISNGRTVAQGLVGSTPVALSLFTANGDGKGVPAAQALRVRSDGTRSTESVYRCGPGPGSCVPLAIDLGTASDQVFLILYGTGLGSCDTSRVKILIAGITAPVQGAAPQGQYPGLDQINVLLPPGLAGRGESDLQLNACGYEANTVRVSIR